MISIEGYAGANSGAKGRSFAPWNLPCGQGPPVNVPRKTRISLLHQQAPGFPRRRPVRSPGVGPLCPAVNCIALTW